MKRGATRPAAKPKPAVPSTSPWGGGATIATMNGGGGIAGAGAGWGGAGVGERPKFLGINEMQKALREAGTQLRETHERNERQLQVVSERTDRRTRTALRGALVCRHAIRDASVMGGMVVDLGLGRLAFVGAWWCRPCVRLMERALSESVFCFFS